MTYLENICEVLMLLNLFFILIMADSFDEKKDELLSRVTKLQKENNDPRVNTILVKIGAFKKNKDDQKIDQFLKANNLNDLVYLYNMYGLYSTYVVMKPFDSLPPPTLKVRIVWEHDVGGDRDDEVGVEAPPPSPVPDASGTDVVSPPPEALEQPESMEAIDYRFHVDTQEVQVEDNNPFIIQGTVRAIRDLKSIVVKGKNEHQVLQKSMINAGTEEGDWSISVTFQDIGREFINIQGIFADDTKSDNISVAVRKKPKQVEATEEVDVAGLPGVEEEVNDDAGGVIPSDKGFTVDSTMLNLDDEVPMIEGKYLPDQYPVKSLIIITGEDEHDRFVYSFKQDVIDIPSHAKWRMTFLKNEQSVTTQKLMGILLGNTPPAVIKVQAEFEDQTVSDEFTVLVKRRDRIQQQLPPPAAVEDVSSVGAKGFTVTTESIGSLMVLNIIEGTYDSNNPFTELSVSVLEDEKKKFLKHPMILLG